MGVVLFHLVCCDRRCSSRVNVASLLEAVVVVVVVAVVTLDVFGVKLIVVVAVTVPLAVIVELAASAVLLS